jgi:hypothetical protein
LSSFIRIGFVVFRFLGWSDDFSAFERKAEPSAVRAATWNDSAKQGI